MESGASHTLCPIADSILGSDMQQYGAEVKQGQESTRLRDKVYHHSIARRLETVAVGACEDVAGGGKGNQSHPLDGPSQVDETDFSSVSCFNRSPGCSHISHGSKRGISRRNADEKSSSLIR